MVGLLIASFGVIVILLVYSDNSGKVSNEDFVKYLCNQQPYGLRRNSKKIEIEHNKYIKRLMERERIAEMLEKQRNNSSMGFYEE